MVIHGCRPKSGLDTSWIQLIAIMMVLGQDIQTKTRVGAILLTM